MRAKHFKLHKMTRILQISDPHIVAPGSLYYGKVDTRAALEMAVKRINHDLERIGPIDCVIVSGDLVEHGKPEEYEAFKTTMSDLKLPYLALPGNHDCRETMRSSFAHQDWMPEDGPIQWVREFEDFCLIGLDTSVTDAPHGHLSEASLAFLSETMQRLNGKPLMIMLHHPPIRMGIHPMDDINLIEAERFETLVASYQGPCKICCGHVHQLVTSRFAEADLIIAPGVSHGVTLELREDVPYSFTIENGGMLLHDYRDGFQSVQIPVAPASPSIPFS
jgi:3',5'-cyclic AMP phosphodiesterase CpdA